MALVTISANVTIFLVKFLLLLLLLTSTFTALNSLFRPFRATSFLSVLSHSSYSLLSGFCSITASASLLVSGAITAIFFAFDFFLSVSLFGIRYWHCMIWDGHCYWRAHGRHPIISAYLRLMPLKEASSRGTEDGSVAPTTDGLNLDGGYLHWVNSVDYMGRGFQAILFHVINCINSPFIRNLNHQLTHICVPVVRSFGLLDIRDLIDDLSSAHVSRDLDVSL